MRPKVRPALQWSQIDPSKVAEPIAVYARLMVQDIRDIFYYYSFVMKKPFTEKYYLKKYGNEVEVPEDALDDPNYLKVMTDQQ